MNRISLALAVLMFATFAGLSPARASVVDKSAWAGALFGLSVPNADQTTSRVLYGITAGAKLGDEYGVGAYYLSSHKDEDVANGKSAFDYDLYGVELTYHFEGEAAGVYFGGRVGMSKVQSGLSNSSPTNFGAVVGVNKMLGDNFSLGGDLSWMSVSSAQGIAQFSMLNFLVTAKLWL